jgi:hypothetical protein
MTLQKLPRAVPWFDAQEWETIYSFFYSQEPEKQWLAVQRVTLLLISFLTVHHLKI